MKPASRAAAFAAAALVPMLAHGQTQQTKPPISTYGVDVSTRTMSIPGMPSGGMGAMGAMMMPGGMGGGPQKELWLGLRSVQKPTGTPGADHMIPPGMNMGASLPLLAPPPSQRGESHDEEKQPEKPKARMLIYWGCGDAIRPGQPKIADTEKMSPQQFGQALSGRSPPERWSAIRNMQYVWPNERERKSVPADASLRGDQLVRGTATPDIRFAIAERQDFMPPLELDAKGPLAGPTAISWPRIAAAQGYFLQAMGFRQNGNEMVIWSSSELQDTGWGLMNYLPNDFVRRMIGEKVVLPPTATTCTIPKGIFEGVDGGMVNGIGYGEELNLTQPPRPTDPKIAWEPIWAVKLRVKSVGMVPLGMEAGDHGSGRRSADRPQRGPQSQSPSQPSPAPSPLDEAAGAVNKLKDLLKF